MSTVSTATPTQRGDEGSFELNGTIQNAYNTWTYLQNRWGIYDLKAPDVLLDGCSFRFTNMAPTIPPKAIIEAATLTGGGSGSLTLGGSRIPFDSVIEIVAKDGLWDAHPVSPMAWRSSEASSYQVNTGIALYTVAPSLLAKTNLDPPVVSTTAANAAIRQFGADTPSVSRNLKFGSVMRASATGTLQNAKIVMFRQGTVPNNCWLEVWNVSGGLPSTLLATSNTRLCSSIAVSASPVPVESFTFTAGPTLTSGTDYAVVLAADYPESLMTNFLVVKASTGALPNTYCVNYGEGAGVGLGNYLVGRDPLDLPVVAGSGSVAWGPIPVWAENSAQSTPDISSLIQAYVNSPSYAEGDPFLIRVTQLDPLQLAHRGFKTWANAATPATAQYATLDVTWRRRRVGVI